MGKTAPAFTYLNAPKWRGHQAGQFLFFYVHMEKATHLPSLQTGILKINKINLIIKDLGDYTHRLSQRLNIGDTVKIDGAYGRFNFFR